MDRSFPRELLKPKENKPTVVLATHFSLSSPDLNFHRDVSYPRKIVGLQTTPANELIQGGLVGNSESKDKPSEFEDGSDSRPCLHVVLMLILLKLEWLAFMHDFLFSGIWISDRILL